MHGFLSNLTTALLALHTVLGCCWHHGHGCAQAFSCTPTVESPEVREGDLSSRAVKFPGATAHQHHGPHECHGGRCTFLDPTKPNPHELPLQLHVSPAASRLGGELSLSDPVGRREFFACDALLPSLRLHLSHRVLLI